MTDTNYIPVHNNVINNQLSQVTAFDESHTPFDSDSYFKILTYNMYNAPSQEHPSKGALYVLNCILNQTIENLLLHA